VSDRKLAGWVAPIAAQLAAGRREVADVARSVPDEKWSEPSPAQGWTYKDMLAHLAVGDWAIQHVLRSIVNGGPVDMSIVARFNEMNEQYRQERAGRSVEELMGEAMSMGEETQRLLTGLKPGQEELQVARWKLNELLQGFSGHDPAHVAEFRTALDA